jgi:membrane associated rhomboid family serine protease
LLHGGLEHVVPNVLTLFVFGRIAEAHLRTRRFAAMACLAAAASIAALAGWGDAFGAAPYVAVYGISGVVFAAAGFAVAHVPTHTLVTDLELLAALFGVCAVVLVAVEGITAVVFASPAIVNVGHAAGLLVGIGVAIAVDPACDPAGVPDREGYRDGT